MRIAVYSNHSEEIRDLYAITELNHHQYCGRHGYDYHAENIPYKEGAQKGLSKISELLELYDVVLAVGADVLFMNQRIKVESLIHPGDSVSVARETHNWWPINNDVVIYVSTPITKRFCEQITRDYPIWSKYEWLWQTHLWNLIQDHEWVRDAVRIVPAKTMNCTPFAGESRWQLGDFIIHFLGLPTDDKVKLAKHFLQFAGEPTWKR